MSTERDGDARLATFLQRYRAAAGLTQEELAERAGISPRTISDLERGFKMKPRPYTVRQLTDALSLSPVDRTIFLEVATGGRPVGESSSADISELLRDSPLPVPATPFIGRVSEVAAVRELLMQSHVRLLTLVGAGGSGKTRLALQAALGSVAYFRDGVCVVPLAQISEPSLVIPTSAQVMRVQEAPGVPILQALIQSLKPRRVLLLLDNFEHVLDAASDVGHLVQACPEITVLVTSRIPLRLSAEREYPVRPMPVPEQVAAWRDAGEIDAVRLFADRAGAVQPAFAVTEENAQAIVEICHRLDGLPLAIELAAARTRIFPPAALAQRLESCLPLLVDGPRDLPARQQTLRATIDWSYQLLDEQQRALFARLSVFAGGCTLEAAEAVCSLAGDIDVLSAMIALVEQNLVQQIGEIEPRFLMLETIREYAAELLRRDGESERIREAHATYFLNLAETAETWGVNAEDWLDRFGQDIDNLRAALAWFQERGSVQRFLRLATSLFLFWERRNHVQEGITWLEYGLTRAAEVPALLRAAALRWQGVLITRLGADFGRAQVLLKESLMLFLAAGTNDEAIAGAMQNLGLAYAEGGDHAHARPFLEESLARYRSLNDMRGTGKLLDNLGRLEWLDGNRRRARELLSEGVTLSRRAGDKWMMGMNGLALGIALTEEGEHDGARPLLREAFLALHCTGDRWAIALALHVLGKAALRQGEPLRAIRLFGASASSLSAVAMPQFRDAEQEIAVARSKTEAGDYEAGWSEGRSMSLDRIGAYALEGLRDGGGPMAPQPH